MGHVVSMERDPRDLKDLPETSSSLPMTKDHHQQISLIEQSKLLVQGKELNRKVLLSLGGHQAQCREAIQ